MDNKITVVDNLSLESVANNLPVEQAEIDIARSQVQVFLIAQAKRELKRVIKLTDTLDKLQDKYQDKVLEYIEENDGEEILECLPDFISVIAGCLARSENIIKQISSNDKIFNNLYLNMPTQVNNNAESISNEFNLEDARSRNKVREAVATVLAMIESESKDL